MQLFFVNLCPKQAAHDLSDVHVRKMPVESAQLLSTAYRVLKPLTKLDIYKSYNPGNRLVKWLISSSANFKWLVDHGIALCEEFEYRTNKEHGSKSILTLIATNWHELEFPSDDFSPPPLVMDKFTHLIVQHECPVESAVESNRNLLRIGKRNLCHYVLKPDRRPVWFDMYSKRPIVVKLKISGGKLVQDCDVYISRAQSQGGHNRKKSIWANPFTVKEHGLDEAIRLYTEHLKELIRSDYNVWLPRLLELEGKTLGCFCHSIPQVTRPEKITCHGDVIANMVEDLSDLVNSDLSDEEFDTRVKHFLATFK